MRITNIELRYAENDIGTKEIHADLVNNQGETILSSTLEHILFVCNERKYKVSNIGRKNCTTTRDFLKTLLRRIAI